MKRQAAAPASHGIIIEGGGVTVIGVVNIAMA